MTAVVMRRRLAYGLRMESPEPTDESVDLWEVGAEKMREVYNGRVPVLPEGMIPFNDVMLRTLFSQVWTRPELDMRDRRLLLIGVIAGMGERDTFRIQCRAALDHGELTPDQLREVLIMLAPYAGYPRVAGLVLPVEEVIAEWQQDRADAAGEGSDD